jgi:hypothetical protein
LPSLEADQVHTPPFRTNLRLVHRSRSRAIDGRSGSISAAPSHGTRGCFTQQSYRADRSPSRQLGANSRLMQRSK